MAEKTPPAGESPPVKTETEKLRTFQRFDKATVKQLTYPQVKALWESGNLNREIRQDADSETGIIFAHAVKLAKSWAAGKPQLEPVKVLKAPAWNDGKDAILGGHHLTYAYLYLFECTDEQLKALKLKRPSRKKDTLMVLYVEDPEMTKGEALEAAVLDNAGRKAGPMDQAALADQLMRKFEEYPELFDTERKAGQVYRTVVQALASHGITATPKKVRQMLYWARDFSPENQNALQDPGDRRITPKEVEPFTNLLWYKLEPPEEVNRMLDNIRQNQASEGEAVSDIRARIDEYERQKMKEHAPGKTRRRKISHLMQAVAYAKETHGEDSVAWLDEFFIGGDEMGIEACGDRLAGKGFEGEAKILEALDMARESDTNAVAWLDYHLRADMPVDFLAAALMRPGIELEWGSIPDENQAELWEDDDVDPTDEDGYPVPLDDNDDEHEHNPGEETPETYEEN